MPRFLKLLPTMLALLFALQVGAVVPLHHFHAAENAAGKSSLPDDCRCDLCVGISSLDPASVASAPALGLVQTAFADIPVLATVEVAHPLAPWNARGPPSRTV